MIEKGKAGYEVSTHSRPKAAGTMIEKGKAGYEVSTHSRPKAAGSKLVKRNAPEVFQHTAARRRLDLPLFYGLAKFRVSTHSRPKAAGRPCRTDSPPK